MNDYAIKVDNVSKTFRLPHEKAGSIKSAVINFHRRDRTYETQQALKNVSLQIKKGEIFGIVGRNGSGKSTLLKLLAGIYQPTSGGIQTRGKIVPFIELGVGFNPELSGRDNVFLNGSLLGFSRQEMKSMYKDIVDFAELGKFMDQKLKNYSSGMEVRLAFSLAIRAKADILLIDEVLAVGDADFQRKCFNYFNQLRQGDTTVVFISHNMDAIREYCDRAMLIEDSRVVKIGATDDVAEQYLKLFMKDNVSKYAKTTGQKRWGSGSVQVSSVDVEVEGKNIIITEKIRANKNVERPIVGFRIRDAAGQDITGSNTKVENQRMPDLKKGQRAELSWTMPNLLRDGEYVIDPAILEADETVADWWNGAVNFIVRKKRHLPYTIDPGFEVNIKVDD